MAILSNIEKGALIKLFNRGGYVLDFNTPDFDAFTMGSIGVPLCEKYKVSKGRSLISYLNEASESNSIKLLIDLFDYYELNCLDEKDKGTDYEVYYERCKPIIEKAKNILHSAFIPLDNLKEAFSSEYITSQLDYMMKIRAENPTDAIGKAKELVESCCTTILERSGVIPQKDWDFDRLVKETRVLLKIMPENIPDDVSEAKAMKKILGSFSTIVNNMAQLRNTYGSGHGKSASYKGLQERHAKLAIGSSVTLVNFLWDSFERQDKKA